MTDLALTETDSTWRPDSAEAVRDVVAWSVAEETPIEVVGQGSKRLIGRPMQTAATLDLSHLTGITLYEPDELVLSARAGTPLAEIGEALDEAGQMLAFEPMDYGPLLGTEPGHGTIGGAVMTNACGPRRVQAGAARDHVLGIHAISGRGEVFKSGGRVMKNVTGYDLSRGLAGSWGTLAVLTDVTVKVLPRPETEATVLVLGLEDHAAARAMAEALGSSAEVSGAAHLPHRCALSVPQVRSLNRAITALRLEGFGPSVAYRRDRLRKMMARHGSVELIETDASRALWRIIRDAEPFACTSSADNGEIGERQIWRCSTAPMQGAELVRLLEGYGDVEAFYDWGGGLVWLAVPPHDDAMADRVRGVIAEVGGHATLIRADAPVRATVPVFQPQEDGLAALAARLKAQFDPKGVLNPGRMT